VRCSGVSPVGHHNARERVLLVGGRESVYELFVCNGVAELCLNRPEASMNLASGMINSGVPRDVHCLLYGHSHTAYGG